MSYLMIALNLIRSAIQSDVVHAAGRQAIRYGTAYVVREIQRQTRKQRGKTHIS